MEKGGRGSCSLPNTFPIGSPQKAPSLSLPPPYHQNQASLLHRIRSQCSSPHTGRVFSSQTFCVLPSSLPPESAPSTSATPGASTFRSHCGRGRHGSGKRPALGRGRMHRHSVGEGGERRQGKHGTRGHKQRTEHTNAISPVKGRWPPTSTVRCSVLRSARPGPASNFYQR